MKKHKTTRQGTRRALRGKKAAALALAVSLWMAGGSVAWAAYGQLYINFEDNTVKQFVDGSPELPTDAEIKPGIGSSAGTAKTLTVTGGNWNNQWYLNGAWTKETSSANANGYTLILKNVQNVTGVYGADAHFGTANYNTVKLENCTVGRNGYGIYGGYDSYIATYNQVWLKDSTVRSEGIFGGMVPIMMKIVASSRATSCTFPA